MKEPKAKVEITASISNTNSRFIRISFSTERAKKWLIENIQKFSEKEPYNYGLGSSEVVPNSTWFVVNECFDVEEVLEYLNNGLED